MRERSALLSAVLLGAAAVLVLPVVRELHHQDVDGLPCRRTDDDAPAGEQAPVVKTKTDAKLGVILADASG